MSDAFIDAKKVTESYLHAANISARIEILIGNKVTKNESIVGWKRGRPFSSKGLKQRKFKRLNEMTNEINITSSITCKEIRIGNEDKKLRQRNNDINTNNNESLINYVSTKRQLNQRHDIVNDTFTHSIVT